MPGEMFRTPIEVVEKSSDVLELEGYEGMLDSVRFGGMERGAGIMLLARVVRMLVRLELRRIGR